MRQITSFKHKEREREKANEDFNIKKIITKENILLKVFKM